MAEGFTALHGAPSGWQGRSFGFLLNTEPVVEADGEVAQVDHVAGGIRICDPAGVFAHVHNAHAVGSVFNRIPVADDGIEEFATTGLGHGATAHIVGDFGFGELLGFGEGEVDGGALDGDEAPTPREPDVLRSGGEGFDAAAHEFAVPFVARGVTLGRKKSR